MNARSTRRLALAALCAAMGCALSLELAAQRENGADSASGPAQSSRAALAVRSDPVFAPPPTEAFRDIEARPLFWASRRPIAGAGGIVTAPSDLALLGVVRDEEDAVAIIRHGQPPEIVRLKKGATLEGWTVNEVTLNRVVLGRGGARADLKPKPAPPGPGAAQPGTSPVASQHPTAAR